MAYQFVRLTRQAAAGWLEYDRPPVNAFNRQMVDEVGEAFAELSADPAVRVVVFASAVPRYFSAGADLAVFEGIGAEGMASWVDTCHALARAFRASPKPILAAIEGTAVGGGLEMVLHADQRFCAAEARLGQPEIAINFIPPIAGTQSLARLMGRSAALRFLYDGALVAAEEALRLGLVDRVLPAEAVRPQVQAYADSLAAKPPEALAAIRRCVIEGGARSFEEGMAIERDAAIALAATENFREGVSAFRQKRKPVWR